MSVFGGAPKQSPNQTVTQKNEPPAYLQPYLTDISGKAQEAYNAYRAAGYNMPYQGDRSAGKNPFDTMAITGALDAARNYSSVPSNTFNLGQYFTDKATSGTYTAPMNMAFDAGTNDQVKGMIDASVRPVLDDFEQNLIPRLQSAGIESGAFGGSKFSEAGNRMARKTEQTIGDIAADITYQDFMQRRSLEQQDLAQRRQLAPQLGALELTAGQQGAGMQAGALDQALGVSDIYGKVGDIERGFEQQSIDDAINYYNELVTSPWAGLGEYSNLIQGAGNVRTGSSSSTTYGYQPGNTSFLQGLGLANMLMPNAASGIMGAISGGLGGGPLNLGAMLLSGLPWSDRRLKENIRYEGEENGHNVYSFNYIWDKDNRWIGVMADEVLKKNPEAIVHDGVLMAVNYSKIGVTFRGAE